MAKIIIDQDQAGGYLTGHIESSSSASAPVAWMVSKKFFVELKSEISKRLGGEFADESDPVLEEALTMIENGASRSGLKINIEK